MRDALGVGALNVDLIYEVDGLDIGGLRFEPGTEIMGDPARFEAVLKDAQAKGRLLGKSGGGSAANAINAMARMGMDTAFLGTVGKDEEGAFLLGEMAGTDIGHIRREGRSGQCVSLIAGRDRTMIVLPNANDLLNVGQLEIMAANTFQAVHMSSFSADAALRAQIRLAEALEEEVLLSFDPGEKYAARGLDQLMLIMRRTDVLFVNEREVSMLTGMGADDGCRHLTELGPDVVVLKRGAKGSSVWADGEMMDIPQVQANVVDTTGAGDVYAGAFLTALLKGWGLKACGRFGAAAAARKVEQVGRSGYPDRKFLAEFSRRKGR